MPNTQRYVLFHLLTKLWSALKIEENHPLVTSEVQGCSEGPIQELQSKIDVLQSKVNDLVQLRNEETRMTHIIYKSLWQQMKLSMPEGESFDSMSLTNSHM